MTKTLGAIRAASAFVATLVIASGAGTAQDLAGTWEGSYRCNNGSAEASLTIVRGDGGSHDASVRWVGIRRGDAGGMDTFRITVDPALRSIVLTPTGASARGERGVNLEITGLLSADGSRFSGRFRGGRCQSVEFRRTAGSAASSGRPGQEPAPSRPSAQAPAPGASAGQGARRSVLNAASESESCQTLAAWANRFFEEYPDRERRRRAPEANLVRDEHFVPMIGRPFTSIDVHGFRQLARIRADCRNRGFLSRDVDHLSQILTGSSQRELQRQLAAYPQVLEWRSRALNAANRAPPTIEGIRSLDDFAARARTELDILWPSEQRQFQQALDERRRSLVAPAIAAIAGSDPNAPLDLPTIQRLHAFAEAAGGAAELVRARVDRAIAQHVARVFRAAPSFAVNLEGRAAYDRWAENLEAQIAPYPSYAAVSGARQRIEEERRALDGRINAALDGEIATGVENFSRFPPTAENRALMVEWQRQVEAAMSAYAAYPVAAALPQRFADARAAFDARIERVFIDAAAPASPERLERLWALAQSPNPEVATPARAAALRDLASMVEERLVSMPPAEETAAGLERFDAWQREFGQAFGRYGEAPPVRAATARIAGRRSGMARAVALADIAATTAAPATAATLDKLQRFAENSDPDVAGAARAAIDRMLPGIVAAEVAAAPSAPPTIAGWTTLTLWEEGLRRRFAPFDGRDAVRDGLAAAARTVEAHRDLTARNLEETLSAAATPGPFLSVVDAATGGARSRPGDSATPFSDLYYRTLDAWMEREIAGSRTGTLPPGAAPAAAAAPSAAPPAQGSSPASPLGGLIAPAPAGRPSSAPPPAPGGIDVLALRYVQPQLIAGFYLRDFTRIGENRGFVQNYIVGMVHVVRPVCASAVPGAFVQHAMAMDGVRIPTSDREMAQQGLNMLGEFLVGMSRPAQTLQAVVAVGEARQAGDADARTLVENAPCQGPDLERIMTNAATWVRDPTAGIPASALSMTDLCRRILRLSSCPCVAEELNRRTSGTQRRFAVLNEGKNLDLLLKLVPHLQAATNVCRPR